MDLAQLIGVLRPRVTIVAGSNHGQELVARFGRSVGRRTQLYCLYEETADEDALASRYAARTLPFATALAGSSKLAAQLRGFRGDASRDVIEIPSGPTLREAVVTLFARP
jgi:hypothetical protein